MEIEGFNIHYWPQVERPVLIAGFRGWGDALEVASGMVRYLIRKLKASRFADVDPDTFYRYDENRPRVRVDDGTLKALKLSGGACFAARGQAGGRDVLLLQADEPQLNWYRFTAAVLAICRHLGVDLLITLGSMYDQVLHTDCIVSGIASSSSWNAALQERLVNPVSYHGPSAIHSVIQDEGASEGWSCISLWTHCPYYLQGVSHHGLIAHLGRLLADLGGFALDTADLAANWELLEGQIQELIEDNPKIQDIIRELRKAKVRGSWETLKATDRDRGKIINLQDFLDPL